MAHALRVAKKIPDIKVTVHQFIIMFHFLDRLDNLKKKVEKLRFMDLDTF